MQSASKRARQSASPSKTVVTDPGPCRKQVSCQIQGCTANLLALKEYNQRFKICKEHQQAESVERDGGLERFCQQCARFHDLSCFDGLKRSCRNSLVHLNERRRKAKALGKYSVQVKNTGDCSANSQEKEISSLSETALPRQKHSIGFDAGDAQQGSAPGEQHMMPRASIFCEGVPRLTQAERRTEFGPVLWAGLHQNYEEPHLPSRSEAFPDRAAGCQGLPVRGGGITEDAHGGGCPPIEGPRGEVPAGIGVGADDRNGDAWGAHRWPADSNCQDGAEALAADGTSGGQSTRGACESGHQQQDSMRGAEDCHPAGILEGAGWADGNWPQPMPGARQWPWWPMVAAGWDAGPAPHGSGGSGLGPAAPRGLGGAVDQSCSSENVTALEDAAGPWQFWRGAGAGDAEDESSLRAGWGYWQARALHDPGSTRRADIAQEWERVYSDICGGQDPGGQSRIYHISMKLFSAKPTNLPDDLRLRLLSWLKVPRRASALN
uniref:Copper responsive regulator 1 n=1 Tax=Tetraselmis sp. GSL018 TaxID=582737 RepID=A0A061R198_9CHLO